MTVMAQDVYKSFGGKGAVCNVSFQAHAGELVGLAGANGGGKTTLLRMLSGAVRCDSGEVSLLGAHPPYDNQIRGQIGYVPQQLSLYGGMSVRENISFYADIYGVADVADSIQNVLERFDLKQFADMRVCDLSGGWARVAQLAASLVYTPDVLLLDEPTAGLDASMRTRFWAFLREYSNDGKTVVISTHDLDEAQQCDRILFLSKGKALFNDTPADIIECSSVRVLFIKNNEIGQLVKKLDKKSIVFLSSEYLGGFKVTLAQQDLEKLSKDFENLRVSPHELQVGLADACAFKLATP